MLEIEVIAGDLDLGPSDEISNLILYEFTKVEPATVEEKLAEEGQVLDAVVGQVNSLTADMRQLSQSIDSRFDGLEQQMKEIHALLRANVNHRAQSNGGNEDQRTAFTSQVS